MADAGANINAFDRHDESVLDNVAMATPGTGITLRVANGGKLQAYARGTMRLMPHLPPEHRTVHLFDGLTSGSLLSIGRLAQLGHTITYTASDMYVTRVDNNAVVLRGTYDSSKGLYYVDLSAPPPHEEAPQQQPTAQATTATQQVQLTTDMSFAPWDEEAAYPPAYASANLAIEHNTVRDMVIFYHKTFGSPPVSTFVAALDNGYLHGIPGGLTAAQARKYLQPTVETALGHMARTKAGINSTKGTQQDGADEQTIPAELSDTSTTAATNGQQRTKKMTFKVVHELTGRNHMDATGRFPVKSAQGNEYLMIFSCEDSTYLHIEPMKNRSAAEQLAAFRRGYAFYKSFGYAPTIERLDNETSQQLLDEMQQVCGMTIELVPPGNHRALKAERDIRTAKEHLISTWATADPNFPMTHWDQTEQIETVLNMMRPSRINPRLSAYEQLRGAFNWSKYILAPFGISICAYEAPAMRATFGQHCVKGFNLGYSGQHHRCMRIVTLEGHTRVTDTLAYFPKGYSMPGASPTERLEAALKDVVHCAKSLKATLQHGRTVDDKVAPSASSSMLATLTTLAALYTAPPVVKSTSDLPLREQHDAPAAADSTSSDPVLPAGTPQLRVPQDHSPQQPPASTEVLRVEPLDTIIILPSIEKDIHIIEKAPVDSHSAPMHDTARNAPLPNTSTQTSVTPLSSDSSAKLPHPPIVRFAELLAPKKRKKKPPRKTPDLLHPPSAAPDLHPAADQKVPDSLPPTKEQIAQRIDKKTQALTAMQRKAKTHNVARPPQVRKRQQPQPKSTTRPQPEYVPANAAELQPYSVRQLKDLMSRHDLSAAKCITKADLIDVIVAADIDVKHKLTARETLAHVKATMVHNRASFHQKRLLRRAKRETAATANAAFATLPGDAQQDSDTYDEQQPPHAYANATTDETTGETLVWRKLVRPDNPTQTIWILATDQEWDRLIEETQTLEFINPDQKEQGRTASYMSMAASLKPDSSGKLTVPRVRGAYGGNVTDYTGPRSAHTASQAAVKALLNAVVSDPTAKCMTADAKDFYLMTDLDKFEYMWIDRAQIPDRTFQKYGLANLKTSQQGAYMVRVKKGMYGLPHAGRIAAIKVTELLAKAGYRECRQNKMVFRHETRNIMFTLVVDDFMVKYSVRADAEHLIKTLETVYVMKTDWDAKKYLGMSFEWDYVSEQRTVSLSMPNYVEKGVQRFSQWLGPVRKTAHGPGLPAPRIYGVQPAKEHEVSPELPADEKKELQRMVGYFRYYAESIDCTQLVKLGQLASQQNRPTEATKREAAAFLDYVATWPNATLVYRASDMVLRTISDGSHRGEPNGGCRIGGIHFLGSADCSDINGALLVVCRLLDVQSSSACETELGGLYENTRAIASLRTLLREMGYEQHKPTEVECDNKCAVGIACETEKQKRAAAMDMRFLWVADRVRQGQIHVRWSSGKSNLADYVTKIHPHKHHREMRKFFVTDPILGVR